MAAAEFEYSIPEYTALARPRESCSVGVSDFRLTRRAHAGDMSALEELYSRHSRRVYSLCLRMTSNVSEAEDLTQEVFIRLFDEVGSFRGESAFTSWLHRLTVNLVLMYFRRHKIRFERPTEEIELPELVAPGTEGPGRLAVVERLALEEALAELPPGYRAVFVLFDIEGYTHEEVARLLGCSEGTSKSQLCKARAKLRTLLKRRRPVVEGVRG
jgi:RNA polymerase sigma-70 factor (ECF subfamily)